jgi:hypothetical protein
MPKRRACNIDRSTCRRLRSSKTSGATAAATMLPQRHRSATAADASLALPLLLFRLFEIRATDSSDGGSHTPLLRPQQQD